VTGLLLAAAAEDREASPIALVVILFLAVALVLLIRSMNKHLRRVPASFDGPETAAPPAERRADEPDADEPR
jgi:hypothetical protein